MPTVELISDVSHYYYTALSLHRRGFLGHYITGPSLLDSEAWTRQLGSTFKRLWIERRLAGLPAREIKRLWLPEIVRRSVMRFGVSGEKANWANNELFARAAARIMSDCDVVHFVHSVGWKAARIAKRRGIKVVCDMREEHPRFQQQILTEEADHLGIKVTLPGSSFRERVIEEIDLADHIFCPSAYAKRTFSDQGISPEKLVVCPYGVDSAEFTTTEARPLRKSFTVMFLGQVCMRKGVHYLLEGYRKAGLPNARLVLAGPVDPAFRVVLDRYAGLFEEVGRVPHSKVLERYLDADLFAMPSLADSYGLVVSEAMSTGLPVIVSENTGMADRIRNGREGFVVPIRDSEKIAEKLTFLYENRAECAAMGRTAKATARSLDWDNYQSICGNFYQSLLAGPPR